MFGLPTSQIENILHNVSLWGLGLLLSHGYFTASQVEAIAAGLVALAIGGMNYFTHQRALAEIPSPSSAPAPAAAVKK